MRTLASRQRSRGTLWRGTHPDAARFDAGGAAMPSLQGTNTANWAPPAVSFTGRLHPLTQQAENARLRGYEQRVKESFARIVPTLKRLSAQQHEAEFESWAQAEAQRTFGFALPGRVLADAWVDQLDLRALFAHATFEIFRQVSTDYFEYDALEAQARGEAFRSFLLECGFHAMNVTPCADGRLAHLVSYVLRLPMGMVRRKSYAGSLFDVEEAVQRWADVELGRFREGVPNLADAPTRYLKVVAYHYSSRDPAHEGCAAHGSDTRRAAEAGLERLEAFREAIENRYCCGASIDMLLLGVDTDTDCLRVHVPDAAGHISLDRYVDAGVVYTKTSALTAEAARAAIREAVAASCADADPPSAGMQRLVALLLENNLSQIDYVRTYHGDHYPDAGHEERFIGVGMDFAEVQLRNLTYFAFMRTVEEGGPDLDVGIKIFRRLNAEHGLPIPIVVRFEYPGQVPGARDRAITRCRRVAAAISARYPDLAAQGLLHTYWTVRDSSGSAAVECVGCSVPGWEASGQ